MLLNLIGTLLNSFTIGKGTSKVGIRSNSGVLQGQDNGGSWQNLLGGGTSWGSISGDIATQTDLQSALGSKESTLTKGNLTESTSSILTITGGTNSVIGSGTSILVKQAGTSQHGYLTSTDWNTFNGKLATNGSGASLTGITASQVGALSTSDSTVTKQSNTFNGVSELVQTNGSGYLPALNGSLLTGITYTQVGALSSSDSTVTKQGNTFNGVSQLVQTNSSGYLTALNGSLLTGITASQVGALSTSDSTITKQSNTFNGVSQLVQTDSSGKLTALDGSNLTNLTKSQVGLSSVTNDAQLKASQLSTATDLGGLTPSDTIVSSQKAIKAYVDTGMTNIPLNTLADVLITFPENGEVLKYNGVDWVNGQLSIPVSAGAGVNLYPLDTASDIGGYMTLDVFPGTASELDETAVCNNNKVLIDTYATASTGVGYTLISSGVWQFNIWGYCSLADHTKIVVDMYKRTAGGTETLLFSATTNDLSVSLDNYQFQTTQPSFSVNATDRLVMKVSGQTTLTSNVTVHFINGGTVHYSHVTTPLVVLHNNLVGLQGGAANEYYHLTSAQTTVVGNTSGANTGDETSSTIKTKLGITTLSGSNTGDETSSTIKTKLGITTLSGSNTGDETQSSIQTKLGITTLSGSNTGDETQSSIQTKLGTASTSTAGYLTSTDWNTFNGKLATNGSGASLTGITYTQVGALSSSDSTVTKQGNTFNGTSQLVQTNASGYLTALNGSLLTGLTKTQVGLSSVTNDAQLKIASNLSDVNNANTALNNILPSQTGNSGKFLTTNATSTSWAAAPASIFNIAIVSSANYGMTTTDTFAIVTTGAVDRTVTLPLASATTGKELIIKKVDSGIGNVIIAGNTSDTIDGSTTKTIGGQYAYMRMISDGTTWNIVSNAMWG